MNFDEIMKKCCICSEIYACLDEVIKFPCECKYIHHKSCLLEWLGYQGSGCPICRKPYTGDYLLQGVYTTDVELPDFEPFYFHRPVTINYQSDLDYSDDDENLLDEVDYTDNPLAPHLPPVAPLELSNSPILFTVPYTEHQFTPDTPLNPLTDPEFSLNIDHSFSIPLYINQNQPPVQAPLASTTITTTSATAPPITTQLFDQNFGLNLNSN